MKIKCEKCGNKFNAKLPKKTKKAKAVREPWRPLDHSHVAWAYDKLSTGHTKEGMEMLRALLKNKKILPRDVKK